MTPEERRSLIVDIVAKNGPLLLKDISSRFDVRRQTVSGDLEKLVKKGCLRTITVNEEMRRENNLSSGAGPLYSIDVENLDECNFISDSKAQEIRESKNEVRRYLTENGLVENPNTENIKKFLKEFLPGGKFEDRDEINIRREKIDEEGLSAREFQEFFSYWFKVVACNPDVKITDWNMQTAPADSDSDYPNVDLLEGLEDFRDYLEEN